MRHIALSLLIGCLLLAGCDRSDAPESGATTAPAGGLTETTTDPDILLERMAAALENARTIQGDTDITIRSSGALKPSEASIKLALERPKKMAVHYGGALEGAVVADGEQVLTYIPALRKYMQEPQESDPNGLLEGPGRVPAFRLPIAFVNVLLGQNVRSELLEGVTSKKYVGLVELDGASAHHLAFEQRTMKWELWISAGATPVPLKCSVEITSGSAENSITIDIRFRDWRLNEAVPADAFAFKPPSDAEKVDELWETEETEPHPMVGKAAPDFRLPLLSGGDISLAAHRDRQIVVLDFWATWCGPCMKAMPELQRLSDAYRDRGVVFYAVNQKEDEDTLRKFQEDHPDITLPVALDADGAVAEQFRVTGLPTTVVVGKDGRVQAVHRGYTPALKRQLRRKLERLIDGKDLATTAASID